MPLNLDALIRIHTIDICLQNRAKKWTIAMLSEKCYEAVLESRFIDQKLTFSKRTIQKDLSIMRSDILGYNAPIAVDKGHYYYSDPHYSIRNCTLNQYEIQHIQLAIKTLRKFNGATILSGLEGILQKLESNVHLKNKKELESVIDFEKTPIAQGYEWIDILVKHILNKEVLNIKYRRYAQPISKEHEIHPYLLKEYRNRWYLLGLNSKHGVLQMLALDRIESIVANSSTYRQDQKPDSDAFFKDTLGISVSYKEKIKVELQFSPSQAFYIKTQPIHHSQHIVAESEEGLVISLDVIESYELNSIILSYGNDVEVVSPPALRKQILSILKETVKKYELIF